MIRGIILTLAGLLFVVGCVAFSQLSTINGLQARVEGLVEAQNRAIERSKADAYTLVARDKNIAVQRRILARTQRSLQKALERNKAWSDTDVPPDIIEGLGGPSSPVPDGLPIPSESQDCEGTPSACTVTGVPSTVP